MGQLNYPWPDFKPALRRAGEAVAGVLFPPVCAGCRRLVTRPGVLCARCWGAIRLLEEPWCAVYGTPFAHDMGDNAVSADAIANPPPFGRLRSAATYDGVVRRMVQGLKYHDRTDLAPWMADWMVRAGRELLANDPVVVSVPLHRARFLTRRFNQSAELARAIAQRCGLAFEPGALERKKRTRQQVGLTPGERERNVRGAFAVPESERIKVQGRTVLLIDDVYTTGATAFAAARGLKRGGAASVDVLTFARVLPGDFARFPQGTI